MENNRDTCPCCRYLTLPLRDHPNMPTYSICELCDWQDDGQNDMDAEKIYGGPNGKYSLSEARENFKRNLVMFSQDDVSRIMVDSPKESLIKSLLIEKFKKINDEKDDQIKKKLWIEIVNMERGLSDVKSNRLNLTCKK